MHYFSCCRYSLNIFRAFQTACSGLKFSIQSYCLLFFLSSFPQNQYVDSLHSLQQATYHIYITSPHCLSSPISVSLVIEEPTSALTQSGCYAGTPLHIPTYLHRDSRSENPEQTHVFEGTYAWGMCTTWPSVVGVTGCVCVWFLQGNWTFQTSPRLWDWWMALSSSLGMALRSGREARTLLCQHPAI